MLRFFFDLSWNPPMPKPAKKSLHAEAPAPLEPVRRVTPRRATADRRLRILERRTTGLTTHIARGGAHGDARKANLRGHAGEPRDRSAGRFRATADRPAQRSDDRGADDDEEGDVCAMDRLLELTGELDRYHGFGKPPVSLPPERSAPRRLTGPRRQKPRRGDEDVSPERRSPGSRRERLPAKRSRSEMAPQHLEKIESRLENGSISEASKLQDMVHGRAAHRALRLKKGGGLGRCRRNFSWLQRIEISRNRVGIG